MQSNHISTCFLISRNFNVVEQPNKKSSDKCFAIFSIASKRCFYHAARCGIYSAVNLNCWIILGANVKKNRRERLVTKLVYVASKNSAVFKTILLNGSSNLTKVQHVSVMQNVCVPYFFFHEIGGACT